MHFRKERVKLHGKTNFENKSQNLARSADFPRIDLLATARSNKFDQLIAKRLAATITNPIASSQDYYASSQKQLKQHAQIQRPRFAHLEEKERRKPVWVGDSYIQYNKTDDFTDEVQVISEEEKNGKKKHNTSLIQAKHDTHGTATQETQLIGMEQYSKQTLEGQVDVQKVKEIRRALRRRYGNRKNFQKIFTLWDEEGKGSITIKNIYHMVKKFGLNMNINEARVLVASADQDFSGDLNLDEFMNMIFNDNEAFNIDWKNLKILTNEQENLLLEGEDDQIGDILREKMEQQKETRRQNQITLILKNKINNMYNVFQTNDPLKQGYVNFEKFKEAISKQQISERLVSEEDIKRLYDQFKRDEYTIDYKVFLQHLKDFQLQSDYNLVDEHSRKKVKPQFTIKLNPNDESDKVHIFDCNKVNAHQLANIRDRANKMFRTVKRYMPDKEQFVEQILTQIKDHKYVQVNELTQIIQNLLTNCGEKVETKDLGALLSIIQYNNNQTPSEKIGYYIYDEEDNDFYERCSQQQKGPQPLTTSLVEPQAIERMPQVSSNAGFYDSSCGFGSLSSKLSPDLGAILSKLEHTVFRASARQYDIFLKFDKDKDGYISQKDFTEKINELNILDNRELGVLINYLDPKNSGALNFQDFTGKIYAGMTVTDSNGQQEVLQALFPAKERLTNMKSKLPQLKQSFQEGQESLKPHNHQFKGATRFGATPAHKNTFLNVQRPPQDCALYQSEQDRFTKDYDSRLRYLKDEQGKEKYIYEQKLDRIRSHQNEINTRIENNYQQSVEKEQNKCKTKGMAAWSYEQRAHLMNDWK